MESKAVYYCHLCDEVVEQVHVLVAEDEMGVISVVALCNDCCDEIDFDYEYLLSLTDVERKGFERFLN